jgi:hypothetical protein
MFWQLEHLCIGIEGVFVGPDIRKLMFDEEFLLTMTDWKERLG